jgi:selenoprotein W-related protein
MQKIVKPIVTIEYCPKCGWLLRAANMAQELLTIFTDELQGVTLKPAEVSGRYTITVEDTVVFDRKEHGDLQTSKKSNSGYGMWLAPTKALGIRIKNLED